VTRTLTGPQAGGWLLGEPVGEGGQATVYRARHGADGRVAAVKVLHRSTWADPSFRVRFRRECDALAHLRHPHVVPVYDFGEEGGRGYLAMPLARGGSLAERLRRGPLDLGEALAILAAAADALDAAHAAGLLHRDVTPDNVLLDPDGPWLADFGLARPQCAATTTGEGLLIGTAGYLAPEVISGAPAGPAADRYALAALAFRTLADRPPFEADGVAGLLYAHVHRAPPRASSLRSGLPRALDAALARGLSKDPEGRPQTARALVASLERALSLQGAGITHDGVTRTLGGRPRRARRRRRMLAPAVLLTAGLLAAGGAAAGLTMTLAGDDAPPSARVAPAPAPPALSVPGPDGAAVVAAQARPSDLPGLPVVAGSAVAQVNGVRVSSTPGGWSDLADVERGLKDAGYTIDPYVVDGAAVGRVARIPTDLVGREPVWVLLAVSDAAGPRAVLATGPYTATSEGYADLLARSAGAALIPPPA
jgi:tRNA A-37 threonylcarbamoyl transferase component Bud32